MIIALTDTFHGVSSVLRMVSYAPNLAPNYHEIR
jgi:hypothetical protein